MRTTKASTNTPNARPKPMGRIIADSAKMNPPNTEIMMIIAATTTRTAWLYPATTAVFASLPCTYASRMPETRNT